MLTSFHQPFFSLRISSLTSALQHIPLDQCEDVFSPLIPFIDVTIRTSPWSVQPLNLMYWCLEIFMLSIRGKLHIQKAPNLAISTCTSYYCPLHPATFICAHCCDLDFSLYSYTGSVGLTLLIEGFIETVFFYFINYRHRSMWYLPYGLSRILISDTEI